MILLYSATLLLSAGLLFLVEPMMGKALLPVLGGAPEVWITTQSFFQLALLAGYAYGHVIGARLTPRRQTVLHVCLLALALVVLPIAVGPGGTGKINHPVVWVLGVLTVSVGLPFLLISANGPLLQRWIAGARHRAAADPYFLYAASNVGSLVGLLAYPVLVEPHMSLESQARAWAWGYGALAILVCGCAIAVWRSRPSIPQPAPGQAAGCGPTSAVCRNRTVYDELHARATPSIAWARRARWLALAFVPSSLMLGTTTFITRDLAPVPLLWVIPLGLYLASLAIAFAPRGNPLRLVGVTRLVLPAVVIFLVYTMVVGSQRPLWFLLALHLVGLVAAALMCHSALAADRPTASHLTEFYLWVALGGALGGVFNALVAPVVFRSLVEYPLAIVAACLLRPQASGARPGILELLGVDVRVQRLVDVTLPAVFGLAVAAALRATAATGPHALTRRSVIIAFAVGVSLNFARRPVRFAAAVAAIFLAGSVAIGGGPTVLARERTFFGIYVVRSDAGFHTLFDGTTLHGVERMGETRPTPLSYYSPSGPVAQVFASLPDPSLADRTAVVGLGTGTMACYSRPGQRWTFYEIDPAIARIAEDPRLFTYLRDCPGHFHVVVGDARRSLTLARGARYGIIALDAFSSDAIPVHLLTRQALAEYLARLDPHGLLLFNVSNRYLDLRSELGGLAVSHALTCRVEHAIVGPGQADQRYAESTWVVLAHRPADLGGVAIDPRWKNCHGRAGQAWSDDRSSLFGLLKWG
jgi:hypothetical protein